MRNAWASSYWRFFNTCVILEVDLLEAEETFLLLFPGFSVLLLAKTIAVLANSFEKAQTKHPSATARTSYITKVTQPVPTQRFSYFTGMARGLFSPFQVLLVIFVCRFTLSFISMPLKFELDDGLDNGDNEDNEGNLNLK